VIAQTNPIGDPFEAQALVESLAVGDSAIDALWGHVRVGEYPEQECKDVPPDLSARLPVAAIILEIEI
jgi:hypothetical protein